MQWGVGEGVGVGNIAIGMSIVFTWLLRLFVNTQISYSIWYLVFVLLSKVRACQAESPGLDRTANKYCCRPQDTGHWTVDRGHSRAATARQHVKFIKHKQ